jgi:hypothetical protein
MTYSPRIVPVTAQELPPGECYGPVTDWKEFGKFAKPPETVYLVQHKYPKPYIEYFVPNPLTGEVE